MQRKALILHQAMALAARIGLACENGGNPFGRQPQGVENVSPRHFTRSRNSASSCGGRAVVRFLAGGLTVSVGMTPAVGVTLDGEIGLEQRHFFQQSLMGKADNNLSLRGQIATVHAFDNGVDQLEFLARARADEHDDERTGGDIQDLAWIHLSGDWEWRSGVRKVFWGVTESRHLVDIINQTDLAESFDGEDKLGQPMVNASWVQPWGFVDFFLLPGFRERRFPGLDGRPGPIVTLDTNSERYESSQEHRRIDAAIRAKISIEAWEIALSHFSGTSREPELLPMAGGAIFEPYYPVIDQTGMELQYNIDAWLLKAEVISRSGMHGGRYAASVTGFEFTRSGILGSAYDLGWILEYNFDDRGVRGPEAYERDWLLAWRLSFNDAADSSLLAGVLFDPVSGEGLLSVEGRTRLTDDWGLAVEGAFLKGEDPAPGEYWTYGAENKLWPFYRDDFLQLELIRYF